MRRIGLSSIIAPSIRFASTLNRPQPTFAPQELLDAQSQRLKGLGHLAKLPAKLIPYAELMRLEKPVGTWLLYIPCTWSILIAAIQTGAPITLTATTLGLFGVGAVVMRGFGCTVNDLLDKDLDNKVIRTVERPIASGRVSPRQAKVFMAGQLAIGLGVLLSLPVECLAIGSLSLIPVCAYPLFKRFTYYPQAVLSTCFNWGALLGFPAMGMVDTATMISLYASTWCWTMTYDTIYAHQDKTFDINAGIKSTALAWGNKSKPIMAGLTVVQMTMLMAAGVNGGLLGPGFLVGSALLGTNVFRMINTVNLDDPRSCWKFFLANIGYGLYFTAGLLFDYALKFC